MAKNSIFWHKKLRQIQVSQNLANRALLSFFGVQQGCPCKNPASVYSFFLEPLKLRYFQERYLTGQTCMNATKKQRKESEVSINQQYYIVDFFYCKIWTIYSTKKYLSQLSSSLNGPRYSCVIIIIIIIIIIINIIIVLMYSNIYLIYL